ncbi:MAG: putative DNA binding domain-containing protein [Lewinellaceae bacterium]|nr:putative DNA binding domain-containing protein [Lewinellaceae bacterium]
MQEHELQELLADLLTEGKEQTWLEFKTNVAQQKASLTPEGIGEYISALSNGACISNKDFGYLVLGIQDQTHAVVGTNFKPYQYKIGNQDFELWLRTLLYPKINFEIFEFAFQDRPIVLFRIPAAKAEPVNFQKKPFIRINSQKTDLRNHPNYVRQIYNSQDDWSAAIVPGAAIRDLDGAAIQLARLNFKNKFPEKATEVDGWDDSTFLNKAKITIKGKITRTAIILLGKEESEHFINPAEAKVRWLLKDIKGNDKDYAIFCCPLLLAVDKVYAKIRNLKYRYIKDGTLFPDEVNQYEPYTIREALNNCIAHQDYTKHGRINVVEMDDQLIFTNLGSFIPGSVEKVVKEDAPEEHYRNRFLATAMFNLKMVDTVGGGIRKMFNFQRERFFPMPDYDLSEGKVKVTISGKVLDMEYARLLSRNKDLTLEEIIMLDKVQKKQALSPTEEKHLRTQKLIEGRKPNYYIGINVAQKTGQKATYSKNKAFDKRYYLDLIEKAIREHGSVDRKDIDELLWNKLPDWMNEEQKKNKVTNLIAELRRHKVIINLGSDTKPNWVLHRPGD